MKKQRILVTVKTYPTLSRKYGETVCTAGIREDGSWVRIYPVPFRRLDEGEQYRKFDWIECRLEQRTSDPRPESYLPVDPSELSPVGHLDTRDNWRERRQIILHRARVYDRLDGLISDAGEFGTSLAVFKPTELSDFTWEHEDPYWDEAKLRQMREDHSQRDLFDEDVWRRTFRVVDKLPYSFSYRFRDAAGKQSELQILDWEIGALYWNCLRRSSGRIEEALDKVRAKYLDRLRKTDLHLFLGTTQRWHGVAANPFVIVGVFPTPYDPQLELF